MKRRKSVEREKGGGMERRQKKESKGKCVDKSFKKAKSEENG